MSSKKAKRKKAYLEREKKRNSKIEVDKIYRDVMNNGSIDEIASAMGVKLK